MAPKKTKKVVSKGGKSVTSVPQSRVSFSQADALSDCAQEYATLIADPFHKEHKACIPTWPAMNSLKSTCWISGTFTTGSSGFGYVCFAPENAATAVSVGTDACVWNSMSTYAGSTVALTGTGVDTKMSNSSYTAYNQNIKARVVAAGVRAWYSGPAKDMGGDLVALQQPAHSDVSSNSLSDLMSYSEARRFGMNYGVRYGVTRTIADIDETDYGIKLDGNPGLRPYMVLALQGLPGLTFSFECYVHFEFIGAPVRGKTPSHADTNGLSAVTSVASHPAASTSFASADQKDDNNRVMNFLENAGHYALSAVSGVGQLVGAIGPPIISTAGRLLAYGANAADAYLEAPRRVESYRKPYPALMGTGGSSSSSSSRLAAAPLQIGWK